MRNHAVNKTVLGMLTCLLLSACGVLTQGETPAVTTWWLVPYGNDAKVMSATPESRMVSIEVTAVPGLDTDKILALTSDLELKPYAGARWPDHVPDITESLFGRSMEASGRFKILAPGAVQRGEVCNLRLEVREFFTSLDGADQTDQAKVSFAGQYQCGSNRAVPVFFSSAIPVKDGRMKNIVAGFQSAMNDVTRELLDLF